MTMARLGGLSCFLVATILLGGVVQAMPPRPGLDIPDPTHLVPGLEVPNMRHVAVRLAPGGGKIALGTLTTGTLRFPVILIGFSDLAGSFPGTLFQDELFSQGTYPTGSLRDYYSEISYSQLTIDGASYGWYQADGSHDYYANGVYGVGPPTPPYPHNPARLVEEAIAAAEGAGANFAPYDNNGDGYVDNLIVIHSGEGAEGSGNSNDIWSHSGSLTGSWGRPAYVTNDGVSIDVYTMQPERSSMDTARMIEIGVIAHELGHAIGLPDLYDTTPYPTPDSYGVGNYCLMGAGSWGGNGRTPEKPVHLCAWGKKFMGWLTPVLVPSQVSGQEVRDIETHAEAYRIGARSPTDTAEYFLVANRRKAGFDVNLPNSGLLIWHIDETTIADSMPNNHVNADENHKGVDLEEADGLRDLDYKRNAGNAGDFYPGTTNNHSFTPYSNPNSDSYSGSTDIVLTGISDSGPTMTFNLSRGESYEPNDSLSQAYGPLNPPGQTLLAYVGGSGDRDYFKFYAGADSAISVSLTDIPLGEDYDLRLLDSLGVVVDSSATHVPSNAAESLQWSPADNALYYVQVSGASASDYSTQQPYVLTINFADITSPSLDISVAQNPYLTQYADIWVTSKDEPLATGPSVQVTLGGATTPVTMDEVASQTYFGDYKFDTSGVALISAGGADASGNDTTLTYSFTVAFLAAGVGGTLQSPGQELRLVIPPSALQSNSYLTLMPVNTAESSDPEASVPIGAPMRLGPSSLALGVPAVLEFAYTAQELGGGQESWLSAWRLEENRWMRLESSVDPARHRVFAQAEGPGVYQLRYAPGQESPLVPLRSSVVASFPNPFGEVTTISYQVASPGPATVSVFNLLGQKVKSLRSELAVPGIHRVTWDGRDSRGKALPAGVYFACLDSGLARSVHRMVRVR